MNHLKQYQNLIAKARLEGRSKKAKQVYYEEHHEVPRCMGGSNCSSNLVLLTGREHFIAHLLLIKAYPEVPKLVYAVYMMSSRLSNQISARSIEQARMAYSKTQSVRIASRNRQLASEGRHPAQIASQKGTHNFSSANLTEATKQKRSASQRALAQSGKLYSQSQKGKAESSARNKSQVEDGSHWFLTEDSKLKSKFRALEKLACQHCGKTGGRLPMLRYHLDRCLQNPDNTGLSRKQISAKVTDCNIATT